MTRRLAAARSTKSSSSPARFRFLSCRTFFLTCLPMSWSPGTRRREPCPAICTKFLKEVTRGNMFCWSPTSPAMECGHPLSRRHSKRSLPAPWSWVDPRRRYSRESLDVSTGGRPWERMPPPFSSSCVRKMGWCVTPTRDISLAWCSGIRVTSRSWKPPACHWGSFLLRSTRCERSCWHRARRWCSTDGIPEARNPEDEDYGLPRLEAICRENLREPAETLAAAVWRDLENFARGVPFADDRTLLVARRRSRPAS